MARIGVLIMMLALLPWQGAGQQQGEQAFRDKPLRIEIEAGSDQETYRIIPCGKAGMILFYKSVEITGENEAKWYFSFYDRNFRQEWVKNAPISAPLSFRTSFISGDTLSILFETGKKAKNRELSFQILRLILPSGKMILNIGKTADHSSTACFTVYDQTAYLATNTEEGKARILILNLPNGTMKEVILLNDQSADVLTLSAEPASGMITALVRKEISKRNTEMWQVRLGMDGTLLSEDPVGTFNSGSILIKGKEKMTTSGQTLIAGAYLQAEKTPKEGEYATTGLFATTFTSRLQSSIFFYNFLDLKNIRELLREQDILDLRKKSMKKNRTSDGYSLDLSLLLHDIIPWQNQNLLVAETYYPEFHTESFTDYDFYGRPFTNTYTIFDGYRFTGVLVASFDDEGKLLWDNAMPVRNLISFRLEPNVTLFPSGEEIILAYLSDGKIATRILDKENTVEGTTYSALEMLNPGDKLLEETNSGLLHWYDDAFLCYGYQEIRDVSQGRQEKRLVFFCSKLVFER